ncbi:MAG: hypothetical protein ACOCZM_02920, partial [Bacillota bacterium]
MLKRAGIILIAVVFVAAVAGCSGDDLGPSWDTTMKLPAANEEGDIGGLTGAQEFHEFGYEIDGDKGEEDIEVFMVGEEDNPISREMEMSLPELSIGLDEPLFDEIEQDGIPVDNGEETIEEPIIEEPISVDAEDIGADIEFGSSAAGENTISVAVKVPNNASNNQLDLLTVEVLNTEDREILDSKDIEAIEPGDKDEVEFDLSGEELNDGLEFKLNYEQDSGITEFDLAVTGPEELNVVSV